MTILFNLTKVALTLIALLIFSKLSFGQNSSLFERVEILEMTLKGDVKGVLKNTKGDPTYFDFTFGYSMQDGESAMIPIRVRTRGHFRREMNFCTYPPLLLNFSKKETENTIFSSQNKLKLVLPCQGERYVIREYFAYKLYNLLTPLSFKVRLVRLRLVDQSENAKTYESFLGFLIEDEDHLAERNQMNILDKDLVSPERIVEEDFFRMAVFQYLIGNTDWSIQFRQNIKLMHAGEHERPIAVPYDFDHAGIVRAPYANPAPELKLASVTDRRYRGYCVEEMEAFQKVFSEFLAKKDEIYSLYTKSELLDEKYVKFSTRFLDGFYDAITNPKRAAMDFQYPCLSDGTGNIVIKGLN
ncbi:hypothetical protein [Algoriphagus litoralis]|uniref:hypothetical protein n=1 Tax=Algoriphagus litoralis TaxID=2202829 RepID=UPI000DBA3639|nr:hypothetical protein [Algoriphagus litoralis]